MPTFFRRLSLVFATGYAVTIVSEFAGLISFDVFSLPLLIGGFIGSALVTLVISDYSRRPSFRVRGSSRDRVVVPPTARLGFDDSALWTYTTRSV